MEKNKNYDYSRKDIVRALKEVGISKGDSIFSHSNIGFFGRLRDASTPEDYYLAFKEAIFEVIGEEGTLGVPAFSYSFCRGEVFDCDKTPGVCGFFSEMLRKDPDALRSEDANFSIAAIGKDARYFTENISEYSFGPGSFSERFIKRNGKVCNFNFDSVAMIVHYTERLLGVSYRYDKAFHGKSIIDSREVERTFYHFVRDLNKAEDTPEFSKFDKKAREAALDRRVNLGKGQVVSIAARTTVELIKKEIKKDPSFLTRGRSAGTR